MLKQLEEQTASYVRLEKEARNTIQQHISEKASVEAELQHQRETSPSNAKRVGRPQSKLTELKERTGSV